VDRHDETGQELVSVLPGPTGEQHVAYLIDARLLSLIDTVCRYRECRRPLAVRW
jgi:hypothetical protein